MSPERPRRPDCSMVATLTQTRCTATATRWVQVGCVHEHLKLGAACTEHARMLLDGDKRIHCTFCKHGTAPHRCKLLARVISSEEKDRIVRAMRATPPASPDDRKDTTA